MPTSRIGSSPAPSASEAIFVYTGKTQTTVAVGDEVQVTGTADEYRGRTQISGKIEVTPLNEGLEPVRPLTMDWASTDGKRENLESMLYLPNEKFLVSDVYPVGRYGEIGLASGKQLPTQPTDIARPTSPEAKAQAERNDAISVILDDGTGQGFAASPTLDPRPVPYIDPEDPIDVGDSAHITEPVIIDYRYDTWRLQPTRPITDGDEPARFHGRAHPVPKPGGQISIASFNVLNYFTTTGDELGCKGGNYSTDGTNNVAGNPCDVRGVFDRDDLHRQQAKTVAAINRLDASVVGLMEMENSAKLGEGKDEATKNLVAALNKDAGYAKWDYIEIPDSELPAIEDQDFITNAIIYQPAEARPTGHVQALDEEAGDNGAFHNARTPIAATFTAVKSGKKAVPTTVVVNHFKSKGSAPKAGPNKDQGDGQGNWNAARIEQAQALVDWTPQLVRDSGSADIAMLGDFNSYAQEDPMHVLYGAHYRPAATGEFSYVFGGQVGSLDHLLLSPSLAARMTGADVWNINSVQSPLLQYAQYRTVGEDFYRPDATAFSDHDPYIAGFRAK
ncbi:ExeM/NucH family extracellular endonuclease [Helcobacillus massiliensis]|uniref:Putative extracellular nuclease n=2 Tax=Dermabacteraceae TaxID=85020 RepID=A0A839QZA4_9MICO|nr:putative extracellular nuclease [Helcobacillus massiliensis]